MSKFRVTSGDVTTASTDEIIETLLVESGAAERLPTNEGLMLDFLGLRQLSFDFMHELDFIEGSDASSRNLRAALSLNDRIVAVQANLGEKRSRFSILHEIAHFILPEHRERLFLDDDETLGFWTKARLEREANRVAADLIFQGDRFTNQSIDHPISCRTILKLAPQYGASYEAALRRFAERHVLPCAVLVYDKIAKTNETDFEDDRYRLQYTVTSEPFRKQFFAGVQTSEPSLPASELYSPQRWGEIVNQELLVENWRFDTEIFNNGYKIFQLVVRPLDIRH